MLQVFFLRKIISGVFLGILYLLWPHTSSALTISPLRQTIVLGPGQVQTVVVEIRNTENVPVNLIGETDAFTLDNQGRIRFDVTDEAVSWIQSAPKKLTLEPNQNGKIFFTIKTPKTGLSGSHYVVLFVREMGEAEQISVGQRVGSLLFMHPAGVTREQVEINYWYPKQAWHRGGQIEWFLRAHNQGTIHLLPKIEVTMRTYWGKPIYTKTILAQGIILPDGSLEKNWTDAALPWWAVGQLQVDLALTYGLSQRTEQITRTIWYWPTVLAVPGLLTTSVVLALYCVARYRRSKL